MLAEEVQPKPTQAVMQTPAITIRSMWRRLSLVLILALAAQLAIAEERWVSGIVTYVDADQHKITVRNEVTEQRRTYFVTPATKFASQGKNIALADIKRGHVVTLSYRNTEQGREVAEGRVPAPAHTAEITPIEAGDVGSLSGYVTGVRRSQNMLTFRADVTQELWTVELPQVIGMRRDGRSIVIKDIKKGDYLTVVYRWTPRGPEIVSGRAATSGPE